MTAVITPKVGSPGDQVGFVTLEAVLGKPGEQGEVWLAHATGYENVKFAVKLSRKAVINTNDKNFLEFQNEFKILALLNHPNIIKVFACGIFPKDNKSYPYYVMEFMGENVSPFHEAFTETGERDKIKLWLRVLLDTSSALQHVHGQEVCHQDVKAPNILVCKEKGGNTVIKLIDFGFSKLLPEGLPDKAPTNASSCRCPLKEVKPKNHDLWQLAFTLNNRFNIRPFLAKEILKNTNTDQWPIDYADVERLLSLLADWHAISPSPQTKVEAGDIAAFYAEIQDVSRYGSTSDLGPDVKGAQRYFSVPEIATTAQIQPAFQAIRIPHRQHILYTKRISELITRPEFGVLRYTRQLGFTHLVYPGAQGTRFEHSLGVYNLACRLVIRMAGHSPFRRACGNPKEVLKFLLACLLHDIGHFPLAHQLEEFKGKENDFPNEKIWAAVKGLVSGHRKNGRRIILGSLKPFLLDKFGLTEKDLDDILTLMIDKEKIDEDEYEKLAPSVKFLNNLLCGPTDLDKFDYIERDAHHCGVPYGNFLDVERALETMRVLEHDNVPIIAFDRRGVGCLEQLATARHQMFANVYWHRAVRSATVMFKHAFYLFAELFPDENKLHQIFLTSGSDDAVLQTMLKEVAVLDRGNQKVNAVNRLLLSVCGTERVLYKVVVHATHSKKIDFGGDFYEGQRKVARHIYNLLRNGGYLLPEVENNGGEHNVLIDCRQDSSPPYENVKIIDEHGMPANLVDAAPSIRGAREDFVNQACKIRVFVNPLMLSPDYCDKEGRDKIEKFILRNLKK